MTSTIRKRLGPLSVVATIAVIGALAAFIALAALPEITSAQDPPPPPPPPGAEPPGGGGGPPAPPPPPTVAPTTPSEPQANGFVATAAAGRTVELAWRPIEGATGYEIRYQNLDMDGSAWSSTIEVSADKQMYTLEDDDLVDGALYEVQLRAAGASWNDASSLEVLGPVIQFSSDTPFMESTGMSVRNWELPRASQAKGDMVRYSIVPALPKGLKYGQEAGEDYVDLAASEHPSITGAVGHTVGGSNQFYRLTGCDVEKGIPDYESCDTHIFQIEITPATVKPLADVIRDREYVIDEALPAAHPLNQFPQVVVDSDTEYEYQLLLTETYHPLNLDGLTFNPETRRLSGTPTLAAKGEYRVIYRANTATSNVFHEAEFTIKIVEIETHACRIGLNYEETLEVYNTEVQVGSANFTVRAASEEYYVLPIGEKGQRGAGQARTRTFELITVEKGGDLAAPDADMLPDGLQVVSLQVDEASRNPVTNDDPDKWLYTRQGFYNPAGQPTAQMLMDGRYADPEPDYPATDEGNRLAIGVSNPGALREGAYQSCFIVHDTDDDTGETDSSAVVFNLNVLPDLRALDWVIELTSDRNTSELDVDEAFSTSPALLNFEAMYVDEFAAKNATGCIADAAANPKDIVAWTTNNDKVVFTAKEVTQTETQRVQVKASLKTGGSEACVQVRITVLHPDDEQVDPPPAPTALTAPTNVTATADGNSVTIMWGAADNADRYIAVLFDSNWEFDTDHVATHQTDGSVTFDNVPAGTYTAAVISIMDDASGNATDLDFAIDSVTVN